MRGVSGGRVLHREAHVAYLLRNEGEYAPHVAAELLDLRGHRRVGLRHVLLAQAPVPARDLRPVPRRRDAHVLHLGVERRHVRLGERLRGVSGGEEVHGRAVRAVRHVRRHVAKRVPHRDAHDRQLLGRSHLVGGADDRAFPLHDGEPRPLPLAAGPQLPPPGLHVHGVADLEAGDGADDPAVERVVDVLGHRPVVGGLLHRRGDVDLSLAAVGAYRADVLNLGLAVALRVVERHFALLAAPFLCQNLHPALEAHLVRPVRIVGDAGRLVYYDGVGVGVPFARHVLGICRTGLPCDHGERRHCQQQCRSVLFLCLHRRVIIPKFTICGSTATPEFMV